MLSYLSKKKDYYFYNQVRVTETKELQFIFSWLKLSYEITAVKGHFQSCTFLLAAAPIDLLKLGGDV